MGNNEVDRHEKNLEKCRQNNINSYLKSRDEYLDIMSLVVGKYNNLKGKGKTLHRDAELFPFLDRKLRNRLKDIGRNLLLMEELLDETIKQIEDEDNRCSGGFSKREWALSMPERMKI